MTEVGYGDSDSDSDLTRVVSDVSSNTSEGQVRQAVCLFLMRCLIKG